MTKEKTKEEVEVPKKFEDIIKKIEEMSVIDLAELVKILEKKFGVSAMTSIVAAPAAVVGVPTEITPVQEKSVFNIELIAVGDKKIEVIKLIKDVIQKGLKEAKDLVDVAATSPQMIKENVKKEEAEEMKKKFEAVGAKVELK
jgi:large subunit ribosomal protein L7/L12